MYKHPIILLLKKAESLFCTQVRTYQLILYAKMLCYHKLGFCLHSRIFRALIANLEGYLLEIRFAVLCKRTHTYSSDGHTLDDISIMPIEEVVLESNDVISLPSKRLQREEYWYRELCTVYPYGLNNSVKGVGNVSSRTDDGLVYSI